MEIIQLVAVNCDYEAQHIVGQSRKPCRVITQQVEYFRHFVLGSGTDIDRRAVTAIHRREERAFEIRQRDLFTPESGRLLYGSRLGADRLFFQQSVPILRIPFPIVFPSGVSVSSSSGSGIPADDFRIQRGLSGDHLTHQFFVDFDTGTLRWFCCEVVGFF